MDLPKQTPIQNAPGAATLLAKAVDTSAQIVQPQGKSRQPSPSESSEKLPQPLLDKLWLKMAEMYGHRWTSNFGVSADQEHSWAKILGGLTGQQLANGLQELVDRATEFEWPPAANVFRALCMKLKGWPSAPDAWGQALQGRYSHKAVRIAAEATGIFDLRNAKSTDRALRERFERNYAVVQRCAEEGQPLDGRITEGLEYQNGMRAQLARSHQEARDLIAAQNIPTDPKAARALLLAKVGLRRPA